MRQLIISGRLGKDPETKATQNGKTFCWFKIVDNKKSADGKEDKLWVRVKVFGAMGDACQRFLHKGSWVIVSGELSVDEYDSQEGKHYVDVSVMANSVEFGPKQDNGGQQGGGYGQPQQYGGGYAQPPQQQGYYQQPPQPQQGGYQQQPQTPPPDYNAPAEAQDNGDSPF